MAQQLLTLHVRPPRRAGGAGVALFDLGFRPFFLLAASFGAAAVPLWLIALRGGLQPGGSFGAMQWHAHEMLFGFTTAVIAGFLLTAAGNWTGRPVAQGTRLAALAFIWLLGRVAVFFAGVAPRTAAVVDTAFLPLLALTCAVPIVAAKSRRNYVFLVLLAALAACNVTAHAAALSSDLAAVQRAHGVALHVIVLVIAVVTGRIVPSFTRNATAASGVESSPTFERAAVAAVVATTVAAALGAPPSLRGALCLLAALTLALRMRRWGTWAARREPLLWILHLGSAWLPVGFALQSASLLMNSVPPGSALHALTAGAIGSLTLGMMARVSLGHTGRMLRAGRLTSLAFTAVAAAGALRVLAPLLPSSIYMLLLDSAGVLWSLAFALFCASHGPMLFAPRVDAT
jgi:uncharacterized protein involved in response to NO